MAKSIFIGAPYIIDNEKYVRLCSDIKFANKKLTVFYEVPIEYKKYLCTERVNSFVLAILEFAMYMNYDIESDTPIDESLHYQLTNYGPRILSDQYDHFHPIKIKVPYSSVSIKSANGVGTGFSGGIDSFYTVYKHINPKENNYKLTHVLLANVGAFTGAVTAKTEKIFYKQVENLSPAAEKLHLPLISVNSNIIDLYLTAKIRIDCANSVIAGSPLKTISCAYALQKLFSVYYMASSLKIERFEFKDSPDFSLLYYVKLTSTNSINIYASGVETDRIHKVKYVANSDVVQNYLSIDLGNNCSKCTKCVRTMFELYSLNMLDKFGNVFDIDDFKKHLSSRLGKYFNSKKDKYDGFIGESISMCRKNRIKIPTSAYIKAAIIYKPYEFLKNHLRKNNLVRKIYYKLNIDILLYGKDAKISRDLFTENIMK